MIAITTPAELIGRIVYLLAGARVFGSVAQLCGPEVARICDCVADWSVETAEVLEDLARDAGCLPDRAALRELVDCKAVELWNAWNEAYEAEVAGRC